MDACVIIHNMVVEHRFGGLTNEEEEAARTRRFPLFGYTQVDRDTAAQDGLTWFAARVSIFNNRITSKAEHYKLKTDLVEHIHTNFPKKQNT